MANLNRSRKRSAKHKGGRKIPSSQRTEGRAKRKEKRDAAQGESNSLAQQDFNRGELK